MENLTSVLLLQLLPWEIKTERTFPLMENNQKVVEKKKKDRKKAERCWCGTHLLYHRAFAPPNLSNPPKSLCKRQKERKRKKMSCKPRKKSAIKNRGSKA